MPVCLLRTGAVWQNVWASLKLLTLHVQLRDHVSVQENLPRVFHTYGHGAEKEHFRLHISTQYK
jgi:hypothetical protein